MSRLPIRRMTGRTVGGFVGEMQADAELHRFGFSGRLQVRVQHEACLRLQPPRRAGHAASSNHARRPNDELTVGIFAPGHAVVTRLVVFGVAADRFVAGVDAEPRMMRHAADSWAATRPLRPIAAYRARSESQSCETDRRRPRSACTAGFRAPDRADRVASHRRTQVPPANRHHRPAACPTPPSRPAFGVPHPTVDARLRNHRVLHPAARAA